MTTVACAPGFQPGFHGPTQSKWHLAPDFTPTRLSADCTISDAIDIVLKAKNKKLTITQKQILVNNICKFINGKKTIKYLNDLTENDWDKLSEDYIPLICKLYLRHLLVQSFQYQSKQQLLEYDFNWGITYDFNNNSIIQTMVQCGFSFDDACEAVMVTDNKSVDLAINYSLLDDNHKKQHYEQQKIKLNRIKTRTLGDHDYYKHFRRNSYDEKSDCSYSSDGDNEGAFTYYWQHKLKSNNKNQNIPKKDKNNEILKQIAEYKQKLNELKIKKMKLETNINNQKMSNKLILYKHYVSGMLAELKLTISHISEWKKYRNDNNISDNQHIYTLKQFGYNNDDELDVIKDYININADTLNRVDSNGSNSSQLSQSTTTKATGVAVAVTRKNLQCVVCYDSLSLNNPQYMLLPCNHICLCEECVDNYYGQPHDDQKCPLCCTKVNDAKKVYFQ